jgi:hypothetical protein
MDRLSGDDKEKALAANKLIGLLNLGEPGKLKNRDELNEQQIAYVELNADRLACARENYPLFQLLGRTADIQEFASLHDALCQSDSPITPSLKSIQDVRPDRHGLDPLPVLSGRKGPSLGSYYLHADKAGPSLGDL